MNTKYLEIIKAPVITEKSAQLAQEGKYAFKVDPRANKTEIKMAIDTNISYIASFALALSVSLSMVLLKLLYRRSQ